MRNLTLKIIFLFCISVLSVLKTYSQENDVRFLFTGQIISEDEKPVALAHIINIGTKTGIASDTLGFFKIWVNKNDILNISAIGFEYLEYLISEINPDSLQKIKLKRRIYEIPEVAISYFGTYKDFEYKVLNLKLDDKYKINEQVLKDLPVVEDPKPYEPTLGSPISLLYDLFSHEGKSRRKYVELMEEQPKKLKIEARYNRDIVRNITGLDGKDLSQFMDSCAFSDMYILNTSDYLLYAEIAKLFEDYKKRHNLVEDKK